MSGPCQQELRTHLAAAALVARLTGLSTLRCAPCWQLCAACAAAAPLMTCISSPMVHSLKHRVLCALHATQK